MPDVPVRVKFESQNDAKTDIKFIESEIKRLGKLQDDIGQRGIKTTEDFQRQSRLAFSKVGRDMKKLNEIQVELEKQGDKAPKALKRSYETALRSVSSGLDKISRLQNKTIKDHEDGIKRNQKAQEAAQRARERADEQAVRAAENLSKTKLRNWREEQRLYERNQRAQERGARDQQRRAEELLFITQQIGQEAAQLGRRGIRFSLGTIESAKFFEQLQERLTNIEGTASAAEVQIERFKQAAQLPGVTFDNLSQFAVQMGRANVTGEELVKFVTEFANAASLFGLESGNLTRILRQLVDTIDKGKISTQDLNSIMESGGFISDHVKAALNGQAASAENLNNIVGRGSKAWRDFWLESIGGSLAAETRARTDSITVAQENLSNAVLRAKAAFGEELVPTYKVVISTLENMLLGFEKLPSPIRSIIAHTQALGSVALTTGGSLAEVGGNIALLSLALRGTGIGAGLTSAFIAVKGAIAGAAAAIGTFVAAALPIGTAIAGIFWGIRELHDLFGLLKDDGEEFVDTVDDMKISLQELAKIKKDLVEQMQPLIEKSRSISTEFKNIEINGRSMINVMTGLGPGLLTVSRSLNSIETSLVKADDILERARDRFRDTETIDGITNTAEALKKALTDVVTLEIKDIDKEKQVFDDLLAAGKKLTDEQQKEYTELVAKRLERELWLKRELEKIDNDKIKKQERIRDKEQKEQERANQKAAKAEQKKQSDIFQYEKEQMLKSIEIDKKTNASKTSAILEYGELVRSNSEKTAEKEFQTALDTNQGIGSALSNLMAKYRHAYKERVQLIQDSSLTEEEKITATYTLELDFLDKLQAALERVERLKQTAQERDEAATLELNELQREQAEKTAELVLEGAVASNKGETEALFNLISLYRQHHNERAELITSSTASEAQKKLALFRLEMELNQKIMAAHSSLHSQQAADLENIKRLIQEITQQTDEWAASMDNVGKSSGITWQQYTQWGLQALGIVNDILDANQRLEDQLERINQRTERSIENIRLRAAEQGRPLNIQEQRRIQQLQTDAETNRERAREARSDSTIRSVFTGVGIAAGIGIGFLIGGPIGAGVGAGIGAQAGSQLGRTAGHLFDTPENDRFAGYAGRSVAQMTASEMRQRNTTNAADFSTAFSSDFGDTLAKEIAKVIPDNQTGPINIEATLKLDSGATKLLVEDIIKSQKNGISPKFA